MRVNPFPILPPRAWLVSALAVVAGLLGGALSAGLIALINTALANPGPPRPLLVVGFFGLVIGRTVANGVARLLLK